MQCEDMASVSKANWRKTLKISSYLMSQFSTLMHVDAYVFVILLAISDLIHCPVWDYCSSNYRSMGYCPGHLKAFIVSMYCHQNAMTIDTLY